MQSKSSTLCFLILTLPVGTILSVLQGDSITPENRVSETIDEPTYLRDSSGSNWKPTGEQSEFLGTFIQVGKRAKHIGDTNLNHIGDVTEGNLQKREIDDKGQDVFGTPNTIQSVAGSIPRGIDGELHPAAGPEPEPLQEPPRTARDYAVSQDNYGWTYPSASAAAATGAGSASYYPSAEYGKPGTDSKYYSWAAPADDKYKRPSYFTYSVNQGGVPVECIPVPMAGIITEMTKGGTGGKHSIIKSLLSALVALFVIKIPFLIVLKALVFKLFVLPATIVMISLPVLMPLLYFFLPSFMKDKDKTTTQKPATMVMMMSNPNSTGRATRGLFQDDLWSSRNARTLFHEDGTVTEDFEELVRSLIGEQSCVEKIACQFGVRDAQSQYRKPISWVLKFVQTLKPVLSDPSLRTKFKLYRDAYNFGADIASSNSSAAEDPHRVCSDTLYPCQKPQVIVKQARTVYRLV